MPMAAISTQVARAKVVDLDALADRVRDFRLEGKTIVHCHGVFDVFHVGHLRYFEAAKRHGDILVVTLTPDEFVNKGSHRPLFPATLRAETIAALEVVDAVAINRWPTAVETIALLRPHVYVKGSEYRARERDITGGIAREEAAVTAAGGRLVFTDDYTASATKIINSAFAPFSKDAQEYLEAFRARHERFDVRALFERMRALKVLVLGEAIIDEYVYCETLGKSGKEPVLTARTMNRERFSGGVLAIANHLASFVDRVDVLTMLGEQDAHRFEPFIASRCAEGVHPTYVYTERAPTIIKRRYVESYPFQKLFATYVMDDELTERDHARLLDALAARLSAYDVVIVADYGHGMMHPGAIELTCDRSAFLAVNTQVNAGNYGFSTITKYPRAHFISLSERELRMDVRSRREPLAAIMERIAGKLACPRMIVTRGGQGCVCYARAEQFVTVPAFTGKVVDRVGSGDALFAVSALCARLELPMDITGLIANVVGAQAVAIVGNKSAVDRVAVIKHIESILP